jgi:RNA polymerase sigma factor (sigma-70 family)
MAQAAAWMTSERQDRISADIEREGPRLRNFVRRRIPDPADAEDILQDVLAELVESYRLPRPVEEVGAWLFTVARNRITDFFRKKRTQTFTDALPETGGEDITPIDELLPSPRAGPEAEYARAVLVEELEAALAELPAEQRDVFIANEIDGRSFRDLAAESGVSINTLLARKRYAVLHLRARLQDIRDEFAQNGD